MKKWIITSLLAASFALPATGFAQSAAQLKLARQAITLQQGNEQQALWENMANSAAAVSVEKWMERALRDVRESKRAQTSEKLDAELEKLYDGIYDLLKATSPKVEAEELADFYAQNFSENELKTLIAWLESSTHKKYAELVPQMGGLYLETLMMRTNTQVQDLQANFDKKAAAIIDAAR